MILTKADECDNPQTYIAQVESISEKADVLAISAKTGYGMKQLDEYIQEGKTIVFLGSSGVGKSTLEWSHIGSSLKQVRKLNLHLKIWQRLWKLPGEYPEVTKFPQKMRRN